MNSYILLILILIPIIGSLIICFIPREKNTLIKLIGLNTSLITFVLSLYLWIIFDNSTMDFQFINKIYWLPYYNLNLSLGIDGISLFFIILTTFLIPIC